MVSLCAVVSVVGADVGSCERTLMPGQRRPFFFLVYTPLPRPCSALDPTRLAMHPGMEKKKGTQAIPLQRGMTEVWGTCCRHSQTPLGMRPSLCQALF